MRIRRLLLVPFVLAVLLFGTASVSSADTYGDVFTQLKSFAPSEVLAAHTTVQGMPDSDVKTLFLATTSLLEKVAKQDGGMTDSVAEIIDEYGLAFGAKLTELVHVTSNGQDMHLASTKSLEDLRTFLLSWRFNISDSISMLETIDSSFEYSITLSNGTVLQLDYADVLLVKAGLEFLAFAVDVVCAHSMDASFQDINTASVYKALMEGDSFLELRSDAATYLASAKQWGIQGLETAKGVISTVVNEAPTPIGENEMFVLDVTKAPTFISNLDAILTNLNSGTQVDFQGDEFSVFDLTNVFDGSLAIADVLPFFTARGWAYSTIAHKNGDDPTLGGVFPNATQTAWNRWLLSISEELPYLVEYGNGRPFGTSEGMQEGEYNGPYTSQLGWQEGSYTLQCFTYGFYLEDGYDWNPMLDVGPMDWFAGNSILHTYHSFSEERVVLRWETIRGNLEYVIYKNGDISIATDSTTPIVMEVYAAVDYDWREDFITLDASQPGRGNVLLRHSGYTTESASGIDLSAILNLLLSN